MSSIVTAWSTKIRIITVGSLTYDPSILIKRCVSHDMKRLMLPVLHAQSPHEFDND